MLARNEVASHRALFRATKSNQHGSHWPRSLFEYLLLRNKRSLLIQQAFATMNIHQDNDERRTISRSFCNGCRSGAIGRAGRSEGAEVPAERESDANDP